ncbi:MAG: Holliday junction branch migration protein RuvA [SAR324 cluster bacterium]|nr:Holliday junction branch migration protein RuvA [SAR324 cluster bacterium]
MIAHIEGTVFLAEPDYLVIKTDAGVGYQIFVPQPLLIQATKNKAVQFHIHTHVREGEITLYGFETLEEKKIFEMLIKTTGVGPKLAIVTLSNLRPPQLLESIYNQNISQLNAVPGIGKKTASKICLDMADLLKKHPITGLEFTKTQLVSEKVFHSPADELLSALTNMGFSDKDVLSILGQVQAEENSFEGQIKKALSLLTSLH